MLSYAKSATARPGDRLNGFKNGKIQLLTSWGVGKLAYLKKKWSVPLNTVCEPSQCTADVMQTLLIHFLLHLCHLLANSFRFDVQLL